MNRKKRKIEKHKVSTDSLVNSSSPTFILIFINLIIFNQLLLMYTCTVLPNFTSNFSSCKPTKSRGKGGKKNWTIFKFTQKVRAHQLFTLALNLRAKLLSSKHSKLFNSIMEFLFFYIFFLLATKFNWNLQTLIKVHVTTFQFLLQQMTKDDKKWIARCNPKKVWRRCKKK